MSGNSGPGRDGGPPKVAPSRPSIWRDLPWMLGEMVYSLRWILLIVVVGGLSYLIATSDATDGIDYASGDMPKEHGTSVCGSEFGSCPDSGFEWRLPATGVIQTRFVRDDIDDRTELRGWFRLEARVFIEEEEEVLDCPAVVEWSLTADGQPIAQGSTTAGNGDDDLTGGPPRTARFLDLTVRRTDSLACNSTFWWIYAGLD